MRAVAPMKAPGDFFRGGGAMGAAMRAHDWAASPLGPPEAWPVALRNALNLMLNSPESMYVVWGPALTFFFNDAYRPLLGARLEGALGQSLPALWSDAWEAVRPSLDKALAGDASRFVDMPITMARPGVEEHTWWSYSYSPIYDGDRIPGVFCYTTETTARVQAEASLRSANQALERRVAERTRELDRAWRLSQELLLVALPDGTVDAVNPTWTELLAWRPDDLVGARITDLVHPDDLAATRKAFAGMLEAPALIPFEYRLRTRAGSYRRFAWTGSFEDGRLYASGRDVTREREREAVLRDTQDFARLALSAVGGVGVWTYDADSDRFSYDAAIARLYAIDPARGLEGIPRTEFLSNVHPDDRAALTATMSNGLVRAGDLELEYRLLHPDGSVRWVLSRGHTYHDAEGRPVRRTGIGVDTTNQRQTEEALRQSQKMEVVGQLTGGVAHDFNNLLTVIKSSTDLLKRPDLAPDRRSRYVNAIADTVDRAAKLTGQLLAFARRQALKPEAFAACDSVRALTDMIRTLAGSRVAIVTDLPDTPCFVNADASQFDTALVNMAVNARDAMHDEGQLTIRVRPVEQMPATRTEPLVSGPFVAVSLTDTGSGIPPDQLGRIFEPFYTTKAVGQGTGLGLSQVFGFAKQSGGEVTVESEVGRGTTFTLYLPRVAEGARRTGDGADPVPVIDGHGTCVLVVEDNVEVGTFAVQTLVDLGYSPVLATTAEEALAELATDAGRFDVVFTDVVMPGMNGIDLAQEIRRRHRDLPVLLASGYSHVLAQNGTSGFELLHKPYSIEGLSRVLRKAARWRSRQRGRSAP